MTKHMNIWNIQDNIFTFILHIPTYTLYTDILTKQNAITC